MNLSRKLGLFLLGKLFPNKNFIGVDIKGARMWTGAKESLEAGMNNVAFLRTSIELISYFFAPGEVADLDHISGPSNEKGQ